MKKPNGQDLLAFLIKLYGEQEGVNIKFERRKENVLDR